MDGVVIKNVQVKSLLGSINALTTGKASFACHVFSFTDLSISGWQERLVELTRGLDFASLVPVEVSDAINWIGNLPIWLPFVMVAGQDPPSAARIVHLSNPSGQFDRRRARNCLPHFHGATQRRDRPFIFAARATAAHDWIGQIRRNRSTLEIPSKIPSNFCINSHIHWHLNDSVPCGTSVIERHSSKSSVTIPFEQTFRELERPESAPSGPGSKNKPMSLWTLFVQDTCYRVASDSTDGRTAEFLRMRVAALFPDSARDAASRNAIRSVRHGFQLERWSSDRWYFI